MILRVHPQRWRVSRLVAVSVASILSGFACAPAYAAYPQDMGTAARYERELASGRQALRSGDYESAEAHLEVAVQAAEAWGEQSALAQSYFMLGLTKQTRVEAGGDPAAGRSLREATAYYERALEWRPESGPILNNLARAHAAAGDTAGAAALYERAIAAAGDRAMYLTNYAGLMVAHGDRAAAAGAYRRLVVLAPDDARAQRYLASYYLEEASGELAPYLWEILERGQVLSAEDVALRALARGEPPPPPEDLMSIVAVAQARQDVDPAAFPATPQGRRIVDLADTAESRMVRACAMGLLELYRSPIPGTGARWWAELGTAARDPRVGVWGRDAYRELARSIGEWHQRRGDYETAEKYYELAANLVPDEVDPAALRDLTHAYLEQGDLSRVQELTAEYEPRLYEGKAQAYRDTQLDRIYEYHRTLGEIYTELGQFGDEGTVNSAVFQLEHAREAADSLASQQNSAYDRRGRLLFGPDLADMLARVYAAKGDTAESQNTRLDAAERYRKAGEPEAATRVLRPIEVNRLRDVQLERYQRIETIEAVPSDTAAREREPVESNLKAQAVMEPEQLPAPNPAAQQGIVLKPGAAQAAMQQVTPIAQPAQQEGRLERAASFGRVSLDVSGLTTETGRSLLDWLIEYLEARRQDRAPAIPAKNAAGVVAWIRFDGTQGTLGLSRMDGRHDVSFAVRAVDSAKVPAFRAGSP